MSPVETLLNRIAAATAAKRVREYDAAILAAHGTEREQGAAELIGELRRIVDKLERQAA